MIAIFVLLAIALLLVLKICKKTLKTVLATGIVLASFYCAILSTDINRIENFREPVFTIARNEEAGATEYKGLGYKLL